MTPLPLADHFKKATWDSHKEAETTGVINDILRGTASVQSYALFLHNLHPVYKAMESSDHWLNSVPSMRAYFRDALFRTQAIEHDLAQLNSVARINLPSYLAQTQDYVDHIETALSKDHSAMLAHIYVRYLGDLNGGFVLKRLLAKHLNLPDTGLTFYDFPKIDDIAKFRADFRDNLNAIHLSYTDRKKATDAAIVAFDFNVAISQALKAVDA